MIRTILFATLAFVPWWHELTWQRIDGIRGGPVAFEAKSFPIIPGSLNLLAPPDQVGENDCLALENVQVDKVGAIWSRKDAGTLNTRIGSLRLFQPARRIRRAGDTDQYYYIQAGTSLYRGAAGSAASVIATVPTGRFGFVSFQQWNWLSLGGVMRKDNGHGTPTDWTPFAPEAAPTKATGAGSLNGDYQYYVTFSTNLDEETNPSPVLAITGLASNSVTITRPAVSAEDAIRPQITKWNVYRVGGTLQDAYRVNKTPIAIGTTTYTDTGAMDTEQDDVSLARFGIILETDHDAPAADMEGIAGPFLGRILAWKGNRLYWSITNKPWAFPADAWVDVGAKNDHIRAVTFHNTYATIYLNRSVWRMNGDPGVNAVLELITESHGLIGAEAITDTPYGDVIQEKDGIFLFNGDSFRPLSGQLSPLFRGEIVRAVPNDYHPILESYRENTALGYARGKLYVSFSQVSGAYPDITYVLDMATGRWARDTQYFTCYYNEGQDGNLIAGTPLGDILAVEGAGKDGPVRFQSRYHDFGLPENPKTFADLVVKANTQNVTLNITAYYDNGETSETLGRINTGTDTKTQTFRFASGMGTKAKNISIRLDTMLQGPETNQRLHVDRIILHYYVEQRQARTFDTGVTDLGDPRVKTLDMLDVETDAPSNVSISLYSALPDDPMPSSPVWTGSIAGNSMRRDVRMPLLVGGKPIDAKLLRVVLTIPDGSQEFAVHRIRIRSRGIGEYLVGSAGEVWECLDLVAGG